MKRLIYNILTFAALLFSTASCTHNNGDIGNLFGTWRMTSMTVDGEAAEGLRGDYYWAFQNNIIEFLVVDADSHQPERRFGTLTDDGDYLILNLAPHGNGENDYLYRVPAELLLPGDDNVPLRKIEDKGGKLVLGLTTATGGEVVYTLKKQ